MSRRFSIEVAKDYFNFASAHFLIFANGRREHLHGHNYQVSVAMEGELDRAGVVLDFITFKPLVKQVCDALDHRTLIQTNSSAIQVRKSAQAVEIVYKKQKLLLPRGDVILLPIANTSTELLAEYIAKADQTQGAAKFFGGNLLYGGRRRRSPRAKRNFSRRVLACAEVATKSKNFDHEGAHA
jgi:6-pyruvoyltetrahydropterin/6-carboxytetrahydropterin synthase